MTDRRSRPPPLSNRRRHPGLRHESRLYTDPRPVKRPADAYPDAQLKHVKNRFNTHSQVLMHLSDGMNLFSFQLPNMGTEYIARLVFDVAAFSVVVLHNGRVSGGICSKVFVKEAFIEIVFCAVESCFQGGGYGRLLMNQLKGIIQSIDIFDILTCADNDAVTYFRKQGFNKHEILIEPERWVGCIKDYDGVTLVHCKIRPDVDYMGFASLLSRQLKLVERKVGMTPRPQPEQLVPSFVPFPQTPAFVNMPIPDIIRAFAPPNSKVRKGIRQFTEEYNERMKELRDKLEMIYDKLRGNNRFMQVFGSPVTEELAPQYFETVKNPMDFLTIEKRLYRYRDYYKRPEIFAADIKLMCDNCKKFNSPDTGYYKIAVDLMKKFSDLYDDEFPDYPI